MAKKSARTGSPLKHSKRSPVSKKQKPKEQPRQSVASPLVGVNTLSAEFEAFRTLAENAPDVIFRVDSNLRFVFVNQKISELTGIPKERFYSKTLLELGLPKDFCIYLGKQAQEVFHHQILNEFQLNFNGPGGLRWLHIRIVPEFGTHGDVQTVLGIAHDITDLKRAELAYKEERAFRDSIERSLRIGIAAVDLEGRQSYVNPSFCEMVGWTKEELLGAKPPFVYWPPEEIENITRVFQQVLSSENFEKGAELRFQRRNGERFDALVLFSPLKDDQGNVIGWIRSVGDITEQKRKNEEIQRLSFELEQRVIERTAELQMANKELESFTYSVSHDLRAPLIVASGFCRRLSEHYSEKLDVSGKRYVQRIKESCQHMNRLIEDLLKLSKATSSSIKFKLVDLSYLVKSAAIQLKETEPEREVNFIIEEGLKVRGDSQLLRIALENLIGNAWKFTSKSKWANIEFGLTKTIGDEPTYFVRDNGCGFDMSMSDRIFQPFQRLHGDEEFSGTGIGLATVHRIIARHGGRIWAEGAIGKGATFFFTLPSQ